ncbi:MAG TPA: response regulator transcription factor, partial [Anaerolineaceae bacterium]|nr:response regulator transcription factor [Anaerolineaceae bacterium]
MAEKILIIDDDVETVRLIGLMLQRQNFDIIAAQTGQQALALAAAEQPDLIVLDLMMPDMDGYSIAKGLRSQVETAETPILMFTARTLVEDKVNGFEAGADDYLTKPVHPAELVAHIRALLSRRQSAAGQTGSIGYTLGIISP